MENLELLVELFIELFRLLAFFWPIFLIAAVPLLVSLMIRAYKKWRLARAGMGEIDKMNGKQFEMYLEIMFKRLGYKVKRTPLQGDYGGDLILQKDGIKTVVQAKRYKRKVGLKAVQEAVGAKGFYQGAEAMVVSNNYYTRPAIRLARANKVKLWDRDKLAKVIITSKKKR